MSNRTKDMPLFGSSELIELMNRRTSAFLELPMRMARCGSPFALWSEQTQFMQGMFSDCQLLAQCMMTMRFKQRDEYFPSLS
jgi:hypothetical protein